MEAGAANDTTATVTPWVSIVIPTRDGAATLARAVRSALHHPSRLEVVVVDDGSEPPVDRTQLSNDLRLTVVRCAGIGASAARNAGARQARGAVLAFLDDDDVLLEGWHDAVLTALDDERVGIVCVGMRMIDASSGAISVRYPRSMGAVFGDREGLFLAGTFATRAHLFRSAGGYDEVLRFSENNELSLRLVRAMIDAGLTIECIDGPHTEIVRREVGQRRTDADDRRRAAEHILRVHDGLLRQHPTVRAGYTRIAGVSAAQTGDLRAARRWFAMTLRTAPLSAADWGRLAASLIRPIARVVWGAPVPPDAGRSRPV